ncbi:cyclase family protein [Plantactinospora sp. WMMB782]|uniref:cyclase family protein n=1 Tax=Plantactinospora sp. WMMB782 TaxID=3404121 RepID=UPI003B94CC3A
MNTSGSYRMIDISGPVHPQMWHYPDPYFAPEIFDLPPVSWLTEPVYSEAVRMPLQTGTYVETAAHVRPDGVRLDDVPLARTVLLPAVCVQVPKGPGEPVRAREVRRVLDNIGPGPWDGYGLLISTGWGTHWDEPDYLDACPYFDDDVIDEVLAQRFSLLGGDTPRFENPAAPSGHLRRFFRSDALLLAPLANLGAVGSNSGHLIAAPLPIRRISASPVRAVWVQGLGV